MPAAVLAIEPVTTTSVPAAAVTPVRASVVTALFVEVEPKLVGMPHATLQSPRLGLGLHDHPTPCFALIERLLPDRF